MLALPSGKQVHLAPAGRECTRVFAPYPEQDELGHVPKIEANPSPVRATVLAHLVPDDIGLVGEAPRLHHGQPIRKHRVWAPKVEMGRRSGYLMHGQRTDLV